MIFYEGKYFSMTKPRTLWIHESRDAWFARIGQEDLDALNVLDFRDNQSRSYFNQPMRSLVFPEIQKP